MEESGTGTRNDAMQPTMKKMMEPTPNCHGTQSGFRMMVGKSSMNPMTTAKSDTVTKLAPGSTMAVMGAKNIATITTKMPSFSMPRVNSRSSISTNPRPMDASVMPFTPSGMSSSRAPMVKAYGRALFPSGGGPGVLSISRCASCWAGAGRLRLIA